MVRTLLDDFHERTQLPSLETNVDRYNFQAVPLV